MGRCWRRGQPTSPTQPTEFERCLEKRVVQASSTTFSPERASKVRYDDARNSYGEALAIADRALNKRVQLVRLERSTSSRKMRCARSSVFNRAYLPVRSNVELESNRWKPEAVLVDDQDQPGAISAGAVTTVTSRVRLSFNSRFAALGYQVYRLRPTGMAGAFPSVSASSTVLESASFRLEWIPKPGTLRTCMISERRSKLSRKRLPFRCHRGPLRYLGTRHLPLRQGDRRI